MPKLLGKKCLMPAQKVPQLKLAFPDSTPKYYHSRNSGFWDALQVFSCNVVIYEKRYFIRQNCERLAAQTN